jgi:hypothetical protein
MPPIHQVSTGALLLLPIVYVILYFRTLWVKVCEIIGGVCGISL